MTGPCDGFGVYKASRSEDGGQKSEPPGGRGRRLTTARRPPLQPEENPAGDLLHHAAENALAFPAFGFVPGDGGVTLPILASGIGFIGCAADDTGGECDYEDG